MGPTHNELNKSISTQRGVGGMIAYHELLFDAAETLNSRGELEVVVCGGFGDSGDDGDIVTLGADTVGTRDDSDVDVCYCQRPEISFWVDGLLLTILASDLGLRNDQLSRVIVAGASKWMIQNADSF